MTGTSGMVLAVVLLGLNAFFVGAEFALVAARRSQLEPAAAKRSRSARSALKAMEKVSLVMAGAQLGITLCSLGLGAVAEPALAHLLEDAFVGLPAELVHPVAFALAMSLVVFLHVVVGEMVPKNLALAGPERAARLLGAPMLVVVTALKPLVAMLNGLANLSLRAMRVQPRDEVASAFTRDEVADIVDESERDGLLDHPSHQLVRRTLGFSSRPVAGIAIPMADVVTVREDQPLSEVEVACARTGFSRFPVTGADGGLVGYIHVKDVLDTPPDRRDSVRLDKWLRQLATVGPDVALHQALGALRARRAHLARVVREDGTLTGVVTVEDLIQALIGAEV